MVIESTTDPQAEVERVMAHVAVQPSMPKPEETAEEPKEEAAQPVEEAAGEPEEQAEDPESEQGEERRKHRGGFQRKIDRLEAQNRELAAKLAAMTPGAPAEAPGEKPDLANYQTYEDYVEALTDWKMAQREQALAAEREKATAEAEAAELVQSWQERLADGRKKYADFDEVAGRPVPVSDVMQQVLLESPVGADLAYWLGSHGEEAAQIAQMRPAAAHRELAKIELQLQGEAPAAAKPKASATKAPAPPSPIGSRAVVEPDPERMTFQEYEQWRNNGGGRNR